VPQLAPIDSLQRHNPRSFYVSIMTTIISAGILSTFHLHISHSTFIAATPLINDRRDRRQQIRTAQLRQHKHLLKHLALPGQ
jgi:hypothetical protein